MNTDWFNRLVGGPYDNIPAVGPALQPTIRPLYLEKAREMYGVVPDVEFSRPVRRIHVAIDPAGKFAAVAVASSDGTDVVLMGALALRSEDEDFRGPLYEFLTRLRAHETTKDATISIGIEMSLGFASTNVCECISENFRNVDFVSVTPRKPGTITTRKSRRENARLAQSVVHGGEIRFWSHFVNLGAFGDEWRMQMDLDMTAEAGGVWPTFQRAVHLLHGIRGAFL